MVGQSVDERGEKSAGRKDGEGPRETAFEQPHFMLDTQTY
jgi:hypothetical protein